MMKEHGFVSSIRGTILRLQSPYLVSAFQNYFGICRADSWQNGDDGSNISSFKDKGVDTVQNGMCSRKNRYNVKEISALPEENSPGSTYEINNKFWYIVFSFGTSLGYEMFYASFFPFWMWNLDGAICRRVVNTWVWVMYIGQALKDIIRWPRPPSPPVVHMEPKYVPEYGMPSTHAMVGMILPFSFLYFSRSRYEYPLFIGIFIAVIWCTLVSCSRLYMGMHTVLDVIAGLLLAPVLMLIILPLTDTIDQFCVKNPYSPLVTLSAMSLLQIIYPSSKHYSPARGDTAVITGTGTGFTIGTWLNYHYGIISSSKSVISAIMFVPDFTFIVLSLFRFCVGVACIILVRTVLKNGLSYILCRITGHDFNNMNDRRRVIVEIPTKFITYIFIGIVITHVAPCLFRLLHIQRLSMTEEL